MRDKKLVRLLCRLAHGRHLEEPVGAWRRVFLTGGDVSVEQSEWKLFADSHVGVSLRSSTGPAVLYVSRRASAGTSDCVNGWVSEEKKGGKQNR